MKTLTLIFATGLSRVALAHPGHGYDRVPLHHGEAIALALMVGVFYLARHMATKLKG